MRSIALVVPALAGGGGVPSVAQFVNGIAVRSGRYEVRLISLCSDSREMGSRLLTAPSTWLPGPISLTGTWNGVPYTHLGANWAEFEFQRYRSRKLLSDAVQECDLIQVVCGSPAWANAVTDLGKPVSMQVATRARVERRRRDARPRSLAGWWRKGMTEITDWMDDKALRTVDAIQVENPWMLEYAKSLNTGRKVDIRYAPPGVDAEQFRPTEVRTLESGYVLCVGRLDDPRKNIGLLLEAYARLPEMLRDRFELVLAGASGPDETFWRRANELKLESRVRYVARPSKEDLVKLYQGAAVFALPSDEEGLGIVVLEAMACGVPAVCTRSGGPEGIITDGKDGYLVPLDDAAAMSERLRVLLEDSERNQSMGLAARRTIEGRYADEVAGAAFVEVWDRLLADRGAG